MNERLIADIDKRIEALRSTLTAARTELTSLELARAALAGEPPPGNNAPRKRAPVGHLETAIESVLDAKKGKANEDIRTALTEAGYEYSLSQLHVGKTLSRMVADKRIRLEVKKSNGKTTAFLYTLPK